MLIDLHVHTYVSGDAKPNSAEYAERVLKLRRKYPIDGFVITEHRIWRPERDRRLADLGRETGLVILQGIELETDYGHILVYGMNEEFTRRIDIEKRLSGIEAVRVAHETGAFPVAAHPSRPMVGCGMALRGLEGIRAIERLNGGCTRDENDQNDRWMRELDLFGTGGSDAHYVDDIATCLTVFDNDIADNASLVRELAGGKYKARYLENMHK